jgi:glutathione S-transferase
MRLFWSSRSPFARKVMIAAHELGIAAEITTERVVADAADPNREVMRFNPLGRIPTLILSDGRALHDSPVIIEYLNTRFDGALVPASGRERWDALTLQALADGVMEADLRLLEERKHLGGGKRDAHVAGMRAKIAAALDCVEQTQPTGITVGEVALGSALAHLDFRFPDEPWRPGRPRLAAWFHQFSARSSMRATPFADQY